ncbi:MAG: hypothetical protein PHV74_02275 [Dehalococcoidia bacterium]|nr:hypothetical protein [Dehalococcoidia bacterium]
MPSNAIKVTPKTAVYPTVLHSSQWAIPVPVSAPISSAGTEDSPFVTPDGNTLYFFFTPDVKVPAEKQLIDGTTGIYVSHRIDSAWQEPQRVVLNDDLSLDDEGNLYFAHHFFENGQMIEADIYVAEKR